MIFKIKQFKEYMPEIVKKKKKKRKNVLLNKCPDKKRASSWIKCVAFYSIYI